MHETNLQDHMSEKDPCFSCFTKADSALPRPLLWISFSLEVLTPYSRSLTPRDPDSLLKAVVYLAYFFLVINLLCPFVGLRKSLHVSRDGKSSFIVPLAPMDLVVLRGSKPIFIASRSTWDLNGSHSAGLHYKSTFKSCLEPMHLTRHRTYPFLSFGTRAVVLQNVLGIVAQRARRTNDICDLKLLVAFLKVE